MSGGGGGGVCMRGGGWCVISLTTHEWTIFLILTSLFYSHYRS